MCNPLPRFARRFRDLDMPVDEVRHDLRALAHVRSHRLVALPEYDYEAVKKLAAINAELFARMYGIPAELVRVYEYDPAFSIKITIPRLVTSGSLGDSDVYGCQQFGPLVDIDIPGFEAGPGQGEARGQPG